MGLTPEEVRELIQYIQENNSWEHMFDKRLVTERHRIVFKYYDMQFDSRTGEMWSITFRQFVNGGRYGEKVTIRTEQDYDFKTKIYEFLNTKVGGGEQ